MTIQPLDKSTYSGQKFTVHYTTGGCYDVLALENGVKFRYVPFDAPVEKSFNDEFFGDWLEAPAAFGAFENDRLIAFVEGSPESWNNRYRVSNICIFDDAARGRGLGTRLMERITREARAYGARMLVLETQTCNETAIAFYKKCGFEFIGFDLYAYSNDDPSRHEVRIEMGKKL